MSTPEQPSIPESQHNYEIEQGTFEWDGLSLETKLVLPEKRSPTQKLPLVCMIGGIPRNAENSAAYDPLTPVFTQYAKAFADSGEASFVMAPVGMGQSEGDTFDTSIADRIDAWYSAVKSLTQDERFDPQNITLLGNSMGGHIALCISELLKRDGIDVKNLVLVSPAAYSKQAEQAHFGPTWGQAARAFSADSSKSFETLHNYSGRVLLSWVQFDKPISQPIQDRYKQVMNIKAESSKADIASLSYPNVEHNFRAYETNPADNIIAIDSAKHGAQIFANFVNEQPLLPTDPNQPTINLRDINNKE
jgi:pimeloyl-ACP methyl ester carboxylesterase